MTMAMVLPKTLLAFAVPSIVGSFTPSPSSLRPQHRHSTKHHRSLRSTPFDLDLYDAPARGDAAAPPLAVPPSTRLVLGLTKYSHDATLCAADASTGRVLFAVAKERLTRRKHDGGHTAGLVEACLDALDLGVENIERVVMNNHHHRILPLEADAGRMAWEEGLGINGGAEDGYGDEYNLLAGVADKAELSHHLAHAYSAAAQCPFDAGLVVVMDGMGETYRTMKLGVDDDSYVSELTLCDADTQFVPADVDERARSSHFDWREAESAYTFAKVDGKLRVRPVFKRFTEEKTPPARHNHGFENMDSLGAVYSRASSHIFGDWNACGKVMGLAPWQDHAWDNDDAQDGASEPPPPVTAPTIDTPIFEGSLYSEKNGEGLQINRSSMMGMPFVARMDPDLFDDKGNLVREKRYDFDDNDYLPPKNANKVDGDPDDAAATAPVKQLPTGVALDAVGLAARVQGDLETTVLDFVRHFKAATGETNLCLAGGVALNSVLNGRLSRELGFAETFVPPYPGDDGVAVGCCAFGLFGAPKRDGATAGEEEEALPVWTEALSPYLGPLPTDDTMMEALSAAAPWLEVETVRDEGRRHDLIVEELAAGGVVALYNGRSELGPRALGHRSILADPRKKGLVRFINESVKKRESFRPFAPSCLAEEAGAWFELGDRAAAQGDDVSPYMSLTARVKEDKRDLIPAVTHVDGSSRLQTVTPAADPGYHRLISAFHAATGVPMVLNTSFNTLPGEPIVESPRDAVRSFLASMGALEMLVLGDHVVRRKAIDVRTLLGEEGKTGMRTPPSFPRRAGPVRYETTFAAGLGDDGAAADAVTRAQMPARPIHDAQDGGWFDVLDDLEGQLLGICDGTVGVNEIMTQFAAMDEDEDYEKITQTDQVMLENVMQRLVRLHEHTLISW